MVSYLYIYLQAPLIGLLLGTEPLGQYRTGQFADKRLTEPLARFQKAVAEIGSVIQTRNQQRRPYEFLLPAGVPQSINI